MSISTDAELRFPAGCAPTVAGDESTIEVEARGTVCKMRKFNSASKVSEAGLGI